MPTAAVFVSMAIAGGSFWNASIQRTALNIEIRDEYERRRQTMEMDLREELRHLRSEIFNLRNLSDASNDQCCPSCPELE